jgi:CheY-like chemotaxis protein
MAVDTTGRTQQLNMRPRPAEERAVSARRILCVDDDLDMLSLYRAILERGGYAVVSTDDPLTGLLLYSKEIFDAVLLDYRMPWVTGAALAMLMRRMRNNIPLILVSGSTEILPEEEAVFHRRLEKGLPSRVLLETLRDLLDGPNTALSSGQCAESLPPLRFFAESGAESPLESRGEW